MLSRERLDSLIADLRRSVEERGGAVVVELAEPATTEEITASECALGVPFPPSLKSFLARWNGVAIYVYKAGRPIEPEYWSYAFEIGGTVIITRLNEGLREFFASVVRGGRVHEPAEQRARSALAVSIRSDVVIYQALDRLDESGNCPVMEFSLEYYPDWLEDAGTPIAASIDEFMERSIEAMSRTGKSFLYWL